MYFEQPFCYSNLAGCYDTHKILRVNATSLRLNPDYIFYYVNISQNVVTGMIPLLSLVILNYLVYKHLVTRRKGIFTLGIIMIYLL